MSIVKAIKQVEDNYVIGDDNNLYRLSFTTFDGRNMRIKQVKKCKKRNGYYINCKFYPSSDIQTTDIIMPYIIINKNETPLI